jgi:NADPH-dependent 2,4-dienoyl-CoA reductase/sulfur reductase-like enzyme
MSTGPQTFCGRRLLETLPGRRSSAVFGLMWTASHVSRVAKGMDMDGPTAKKRIVILGGGFAGVEAARSDLWTA